MSIYSERQWHAGHLVFVGAVVLLVLATIGAYAAALHGPYLLDDPGNLDPVRRWLEGTLSTHAVVFDNRSGPTGRPLSMVTFLADAWRTGDMNSITFKPTNLVIHLLCGLLIYILVLQLVRVHSGRLEGDQWVALAVAALWLWMPMNVSTVLYVVQRMAQLATLWMLATLILYVYVRSRLGSDGSLTATLMLWLGIPLLTAGAVLSKENGILALPLAALVEWTMFTERTRPRSVTLFFCIAIGLPGVVAGLYALSHLSFFVTSFAGRDFTVGERLLTETRILWSYLRTTFFPVGSRMGIFHDNFPISTSVVAPISTLISVITWLGLLFWAIAWRRRAPLFALGVLGYIVAHALEAGPIALELYFEHRNYLPSVFAVLACLGLLREVGTRHSFSPAFRRLSTTALLLLLGTFGLGTWNQASAWASSNEFYALQYDYNPTSPRLLSVMTARAMMVKDLPEALARIDDGERYSPPSERATSTLWRLLAYCAVGGDPIPDSLYGELEDRAKGRITQFAMTGWDLLANSVTSGCPALDGTRVARAGLAWLKVAPQGPSEQAVWRTRYNVARISAISGDAAGAEAEAYRAWLDSGKNNGVGALLFQLSAAQGHVDRCRDVLQSLERSYGTGDASLDDAVRQFRKALATVPQP